MEKKFEFSLSHFLRFSSANNQCTLCKKVHAWACSFGINLLIPIYQSLLVIEILQNVANCHLW